MKTVYIDDISDLEIVNGSIQLQPDTNYIVTSPVSIKAKYLARKKEGRFNKEPYCLVNCKSKAL